MAKDGHSNSVFPRLTHRGMGTRGSGRGAAPAPQAFLFDEVGFSHIGQNCL